MFLNVWLRGANYESPRPSPELANSYSPRIPSGPEGMRRVHEFARFHPSQRIRRTPWLFARQSCSVPLSRFAMRAPACQSFARWFGLQSLRVGLAH